MSQEAIILTLNTQKNVLEVKEIHATIRPFFAIRPVEAGVVAMDFAVISQRLNIMVNM